MTFAERPHFEETYALYAQSFGNTPSETKPIAGTPDNVVEIKCQLPPFDYINTEGCICVPFDAEGPTTAKARLFIYNDYGIWIPKKVIESQFHDHVVLKKWWNNSLYWKEQKNW